MKTYIRKRKTIEKTEKNDKTSIVINRCPNRLRRLPFEEILIGKNPTGKKFLKRLL